MENEQEKEWEKCGYFALSKNDKVAFLKIKNVRYIINIKDLKDVLDSKIDYALIFERITQEKVA